MPLLGVQRCISNNTEDPALLLHRHPLAAPCRDKLPGKLIAASIRTVRSVPATLWLPPLLHGEPHCLQLAAAMMQVELLWARLPAAEPLHTLGLVMEEG